MSESDTASLSTSARRTIQTHMATMVELLEAGEWRTVEVELTQEVQKLEINGVVERVGSEKNVEPDWETNGYTERHIWSLTDSAKAMVRDRLEGMDSLPCGTAHTGVRTVEAGERYECMECGTEHDYETVAAFRGIDQ